MTNFYFQKCETLLFKEVPLRMLENKLEETGYLNKNSKVTREKL